MSWAPEVQVDGTWSRNMLRFATEAEAEAYAKDLFSRWMLTTDFRATEDPGPATWRLVDGRLEEIK